MRDVLRDAWLAVIRRPQRNSLTALGVAVGVGALVAILGMAHSGSVQIASRFDAFAATEVTIRLPEGAAQQPERQLVDRLRQLPGVRSAGIFTVLDPDSSRPPLASSARSPDQQAANIVIASARGLEAAEPVVVSGHLPSGWAQLHDPRLVVVGKAAATRLHVGTEPGRNVLYLDDQPFTVTAVVTDRGRRSRLTSSIVVPPRATSLLSLSSDRRLLVRTVSGHGQTVAEHAPLAVHPSDPQAVIAQVPPDPQQLRGQITSDTKNLIAVLAVITLIIAAVGIANTMLVSVWERRSEIGLRRALGASTAGVAGLFIVEAAIVGTLGGTAGAAGGVLTGAALVATRSWPYALPTMLVPAPLLGTIIGVLAGVYPAIRAAQVQPQAALRS